MKATSELSRRFSSSSLTGCPRKCEASQGNLVRPAYKIKLRGGLAGVTVASRLWKQPHIVKVGFRPAPWNGTHT